MGRNPAFPQMEWVQESTPSPLFCVSVGIVGLTGEWRVSVGMIVVREMTEENREERRAESRNPRENMNHSLILFI